MDRHSKRLRQVYQCDEDTIDDAQVRNVGDSTWPTPDAAASLTRAGVLHDDPAHDNVITM